MQHAILKYWQIGKINWTHKRTQAWTNCLLFGNSHVTIKARVHVLSFYACFLPHHFANTTSFQDLTGKVFSLYVVSARHAWPFLECNCIMCNWCVTFITLSLYRYKISWHRGWQYSYPWNFIKNCLAFNMSYSMSFY